MRASIALRVDSAAVLGVCEGSCLPAAPTMMRWRVRLSGFIRSEGVTYAAHAGLELLA